MAKPSASSDEVNQTCKQTWNAAIGVEPCRAAREAASVTQNVAAMTRASNQNPAEKFHEHYNKHLGI